MKKFKIIRLLEENKYKELNDILKDENSEEIYDLLNKLDEVQAVRFLKLLSKQKIREAFFTLDAKTCEKFIKRIIELDTENELDKNNINALKDDIPISLITKILNKAPKKDKIKIEQLLNYAHNSVGRIMRTEFVDLKGDMTVKKALERIKELSIDTKVVYTSYVVDDDNKLIGVVDIKDILVENRNTKIEELMNTDVKFVNATDKQKEFVKLINRFKLYALPVVDNDKLVGVVTIEDSINYMKKETSKEIHAMSGVHPDNKNYFETSVIRHARNRIVWLLVLMFSAIITGSIISKYEDAFAVVPLLVSFIPMLMDTGGNCGSQSSTLVIRGLATEEIKLKDIFRVLWKEIRVALLVGIVLAIVNGIRIYLQYSDIGIAIAIGLSLIATAMFAKVIGCLLPMFAKRLNLDPAIMVAPLITTLVDTFSILIYFEIATRILGIG